MYNNHHNTLHLPLERKQRETETSEPQFCI